MSTTFTFYVSMVKSSHTTNKSESKNSKCKKWKSLRFFVNQMHSPIHSLLWECFFIWINISDFLHFNMLFCSYFSGFHLFFPLLWNIKITWIQINLHFSVWSCLFAVENVYILLLFFLVCHGLGVNKLLYCENHKKLKKKKEKM